MGRRRADVEVLPPGSLPRPEDGTLSRTGRARAKPPVSVGQDRYKWRAETEGAAVTIKAVVFDLGGVLERVQDDAWPPIWIGRWERRMNLPAGHVASVLAAGEPAGDLVTGGMSEAQMRERYGHALGLDEHQGDQMMAEMWDAYCGELDVSLRDFAAGLRPELTTAILSNSADGARRQEQRRYGIEELVDVIVYSHEVGVAKPDAAIFALTQDRLGVQPHEIVFLDDYEPHVAAARACGWHAVWHRDTDTSIREVTGAIEQAKRLPG